MLYNRNETALVKGKEWGEREEGRKERKKDALKLY